MSREILFRGKRVDNGEWIYGHLIQLELVDETVSNIVNSDVDIDMKRLKVSVQQQLEQVVTETVGQFTGLTDKNGTKIFEGDIVDIHQTVNGCNLFEIVWDKCKWNARYVQMEFPRLYEYNFEELLEVNEFDKEIEVIGNIHERGNDV